jgi:type II secretory pathway pseudopilin PulG
VELSIVLVIVGLLISAILTIGTAQIANTRILTTKDRQDAIKTALITFVLMNNRLPCPAVPTLDASDAGYGEEAATPGTCASIPAAGGISVGVLPWETLGLSSEGADDGYHNRFTYAVVASQTNLNASTISGMRGAITVHNSTPAGAANQVNNCPPTGWTYNPCSAVAVIISHGANGLGAYTSGGQRIDVPTTADESENTDVDGAFVDKDFTESQANPFDDITLALDAGDILSPLIKTGAIKDYRAEIESDFGVIIGSVATDALDNRSGIIPGLRSYPIPSTLASLGLSAANTIDPWGVAYIYSRATSSISNSTGNNTAFTITSYGPNTVSGGGDDIVETVTVSEMQSLFSTYGW